MVALLNFSIEPTPDTPRTRATLARLDQEAIDVKRWIKKALGESQAVVETLAKLASIEQELLNSLEALDLLISPVEKGKDGALRTGAGLMPSLHKDMGQWSGKQREEQRVLVENLVINPLRSLRMDYKSRGIGDSSHKALYAANRDAEAYYSSVEKYLNVPMGKFGVEDNGRTAIQEAEFALSRYDSLSNFMWTVPPTSLGFVDLRICTNLWYAATMDSVCKGDSFLGRNAHERPNTPDVAKGRVTGLAAEESPTIVQRQRDVIKEEALRKRARGRLDVLAIEKEQMEALWANRDGVRADLERKVAMASEANEKQGLSSSPPGAQNPDPRRSVESEHQSRGRSLLRGLISSTSIASGLRTYGAKVAASEEEDDAENRNDRRHSMHLARPTQSNASKHAKRFSFHVLPPRPSYPRRQASADEADFKTAQSVAPASRSVAGSSKIHREGFLYSSGHWDSLSSLDKKDRTRSQRRWVIATCGRVAEYSAEDMRKLEEIDLRLASVRPARNVDKRCAFEIITPTRGRRTYQAFSDADLGAWIHAIAAGIEYSLTTRNGHSPSNELMEDDFESGLQSKIIPPSHRRFRESLRPRRSQLDSTYGNNAPDIRRSISAGSASSSLSASQAVSHRSSLISLDEQVESTRPTLAQWTTRQSDWSPVELDEDTRAILRRYNSPLALETASPVGHEFPRHSLSAGRVVASGISDDLPLLENGVVADMHLLRRCLQIPGNRTCLDCRGDFGAGGIWATIALHNKPLAGFLCIDCSGAHRSLGSHISKVRSVDMDKWSEESILNARTWGNSRINAIWEKRKPGFEACPVDNAQERQDWIRRKYSDGPWLEADARQDWYEDGVIRSEGEAVGRAI